MSAAAPALPIARFLLTLDHVAREGAQLAYSHDRVFTQGPIDATWVAGLDAAPDVAERLEAFVSRFGRMQDTIADKLLPRWLVALAERPGSQIETLNRAERLGVLADVTRWLEARQLRNRLIHEYMTDPVAFAADILLAGGYVRMLIDTANRVRDFALQRMGVPPDQLPAEIRF